MSQVREDRSFDQREVSPFMFKTLNTGMQPDSGKDGRTSPFSPFFQDTKIVKSNKFHGLSGELTLSDDNLLSIKSGSPNSSYVMRMKNQISKSRRTRSRPHTMNSSIMKKKSSVPKNPRNGGIKLNINTMKTSKNSIKSPKSSAESKIPYVDPEKLLKQFRQKDIDDNNTKDRHNSSKYLESPMKNIETAPQISTKFDMQSTMMDGKDSLKEENKAEREEQLRLASKYGAAKVKRVVTMKYNTDIPRFDSSDKIDKSHVVKESTKRIDGMTFNMYPI